MNLKMKQGLVLSLGFFWTIGLQAVETVPFVDLNRYSGKWYEIASIPQSFQRGCECTTAQYIPQNNSTIKVINACRKGPQSEHAKFDVAVGAAKVVPNSGNAKLKVSFFGPFYGDYFVLDLAEDYSYAVVGSSNPKFLWILSRTPRMKIEVAQGIVDRLLNKGYNVGLLKVTQQNTCAYNNF